MTLFFSSIQRLADRGLRASAATVALCLQRAVLKAMPTGVFLSAIASVHLRPEVAGGDGSRPGNIAAKTHLYLVAVSILLGQVLLAIPASALLITNTATVTSNQGVASSSAFVSTPTRTPSTVEFLQYGPGAPGATIVSVPATSYSTSGTTAGPFLPINSVTALDSTPIALPGSVPLVSATVYHGGEPIFIRLTDIDQNVDPLLAETVFVTVTALNTGDSIILELIETGVNTGIYTGAVQSSSVVTPVNDPTLTITIDETIRVEYTDAADGTDTDSQDVLVDPYGVVFSTNDGTPLDGAVVTLVDVATGLPATVFDDDGVTPYPATVSSGDILFGFPPGGFRFPLVAPGTYQLQVLPPGGYVGPSTVPTAVIQSLPGAPYAVVTGSRAENFAVNPGPAIHIDIPLDSFLGTLFIAKKAAKRSVAVGEFLQYQLSITNSSLAVDLTNTVITDVLPLGFRYESGSTTVDGVSIADPTISPDGRILTFAVSTLAAATSIDLKYVVAVSGGARIGNATNLASGTADGGVVSNMAQVTVSVDEDLMQFTSHLVGRVLYGNCEAETAPTGSVGLKLKSRLVANQVEYEADLKVNEVPVDNLVLLIDLPVVLGYLPNSATLNGATLPDPERVGHNLRFMIGKAAAGASLSLAFKTRPLFFTFGEFTTRGYSEFTDPDGASRENNILLKTPAVTNRIKDFSRTVRPRFDTLSATLSEADKQKLDDFVRELQGLPVSRLRIVGHTDKRPIRGRSRSIFANNRELSLARADSVADYLQQQLTLLDDQISFSGIGIDKQLVYSEILAGAKLNSSDQLARNRRVEVFAELEGQSGKSHFIVTKGDSDEKVVQTRGLPGNISSPEIGLGAEGIGNVRLFLEDGRFVDTDKKGLYHFEGLQPGTHVVQADQDSLAEQLEVYQCENNTRFADVPHSRFVDLQAGSLWRADFYVRQKDPDMVSGEMALQMTSRVGEGEVFYNLKIQGNGVEMRDRLLMVELPDGLNLKEGSATLDGASLSDPAISDNSLTFALGDSGSSRWNQNLSFSADITRSYEGAHTTTSFIRFTTGDGKKMVSPAVANTVRSKVDSTPRLVFRTSFSGYDVDLNLDDLEKFNGVIDYLRGRNIRTVQIRYMVTGVSEENVGSEKIPAGRKLAEERILQVSRLLATGLGLLPEQIQINSSEFGSEPIGNEGRLEVFVNLPDQKSFPELQVTEGDSGLIKRTIVAEEVSVGGNKEEIDVGPAKKEREGILSIEDEQRIATRIQAVRISLDARLKPKLVLDGNEISNERIGFSMAEESNGRKLYSYIGVDLGDPGQHTLSLRGVGPFGNDRFSQDLSYVRTGEPTDVRILDTSGNIADGKSPVRVQVQLLDESGEPINGEVVLQLQEGDLQPFNEANELLELRTDIETVTVDRQGYILFAPVISSGSYYATLVYNDLTFEVKPYVKPQYREWIMVGLAEGTVGFNGLSGNIDNLDTADIEDGYYDDGRLAFYAKGKILGEHLLTMAFDSSKEKQPTKNGLFGSIDPTKYYTLYGDNTEVRYDAASGEKLYLKLESDQYYLLFGDYNTGLTVTELSRYSRSLTGLKAEYNSELIRVTTFGAEADQAFVKDELQGDGTSGLYHLSRNNIVPNSEKIIIETRDRFHSENVLESRTLSRFIDYTFDPVSGTIYFREPIYSRDGAFNPVYIVAEYETATGNSGDLVGGGRAVVQIAENGPEIGISMIHEGVSGAEATLVGTDLKWQIGKSITLKAELASSDNKSGGIDRSGEAMLVEIRHQDKKLEGKTYFRRQDGEFGLGQQKGSETGTRKYGLDGRYRLSEQLSAGGELFRQENLTTGGRRDVIAAIAEYRAKPWTSSLGARYAKDEDGLSVTRESTLLTGGLKRSFLANRLDLYTNVEAAVGDDANPDYPTRVVLGGEFDLTARASLFAAHEMTYGDNQDSQSSRAGIKGHPWQDATITTSIEDQSTEFGPRTFANFGLTQGLKFSDKLRFDFGLERTETIRQPGGTTLNLNVAPASGAVRDDFTAASIGSTYKAKLWSGTGRVEYRDGGLEDKAGLLIGFYREQRPGFGLSSSLKHFDSDRSNNTRSTSTDLEFAVAWRPIDSRWIFLDRARLADNREEAVAGVTTTRKYLNNLNANFLYDRQNQVSVAHGIKYVIDNFDGTEYTGLSQLLGIEYRHDINTKWDIGLQATTMFSDVGNNSLYSYGISAGHSFAKNIWLSLGFNITGFTDDDFSGADYTADGAYLKFRAKFDQYTVRDMLAWWEK
jgi:uncharacterized repeat protein (TIGR01451 family)